MTGERAASTGRKRRFRWPRLTRDLVLFAAGLALAANEAVLSPPADPSVLALAAGMMGLPAFLRRDEKDGGS